MALLCLALAVPLDAQGAALRQVTPPRPGRPCYTPPALPTAIALSGVPDALAIATRTCRAFVRNLDGRVDVLDLTRGTLLRTVQASIQRRGVLFAPVVAVDDRTQRVFVANSGDSLDDGSVSVLDAASGAVLRTVFPGVHPSSVAIDPQRGRVFVTNTGRDSVSILDAASGAVLRTIPVKGGPTLVAVDIRRARVFVAEVLLGEHGAVSTLDESTGRVLRTAPITGVPAVLVEDPQSGHVFVGPTSEGGAIAGRLSVLDATSGAVLRSIDLLRAQGVALGDLDVQGLAVDARTGHVFVAWTGTYQVEPTASGVSMLDAASGALLKRIAVGEFPTAVVVDEQMGHAFVTHRDVVNSTGDPIGNGSLSVLDTASGRVVERIRVGWGPAGMALDAQTGLLLVANQSIQGTDQGSISIVRVRPRHTLPTDPVPPARGARYFAHTGQTLAGRFWPSGSATAAWRPLASRAPSPSTSGATWCNTPTALSWSWSEGRWTRPGSGTI
jgi:YVTN family beta-propeller protein